MVPLPSPPPLSLSLTVVADLVFFYTKLNPSYWERNFTLGDIKLWISNNKISKKFAIAFGEGLNRFASGEVSINFFFASGEVLMNSFWSGEVLMNNRLFRGFDENYPPERFQDNLREFFWRLIYFVSTNTLNISFTLPFYFGTIYDDALFEIFKFDTS